jgi:outer membrane protein OmpA-like peptidoglycan-associated protein
MHALWLGDLTYSYLGYAHPTLSGTFGLGFQYLTGAAVPKLVNGVRSGDLSYYDATANLLYAKRLSDTFAVGTTLRGLQSQLDASGLTAYTGDVGIMYRTLEEGFSFGAAGQNLFGKLGEDKLPLTCRAGMAFKKSLPEHSSDLLLTMEAVQAEGSPLYYAAGLEHWGAGTLGLRVGYKYVTDEKQRAAMGNLAPWRAGLSLRIKSLSLDYAYQPFNALGETHRISLTWRIFGWGTAWRMVPAQAKADPTIFSPDNDGAKDSIFFVPQVAAIRDIKHWELDIEDAGHLPVMKFTGKDVLPKILTWEGQIEEGGQVVEGKYYYVFTAEGDGRKRARSDTGEIIADLTPPAASLQASNDTLSPGDPLSRGTTFYVSVSDLNGVDQWQLSVLNGRGRTAKVFKSTASTPVEIQWDGKDDYYGAYVPDGEYDARLTAWDNAGNRSKASVRLRVLPRVQVKEVVKEAPQTINVKQESRGLVVNLSSQVLFDTGKSAVKPIAYRSLDEVVNLLQTYPENEVLIEGYTDSTGSRAKNIEISSARAWSVYSYLVKKGVAPVRLKPKGYGPDKPVASNRSQWERAQNRRVEIIVLKKEPPLQPGTTIQKQ